MAVFVLDKQGQPLMPCSEKRARLLLARGRARVHRLVPYAIRLVDRAVADCALQPLRLKLDPGSKATGLALVRDTGHVEAQTGEIQRSVSVLSLFQLVHRGQQISQALTARRQMRRRRRGVNLRYRAPRFLNRTRPPGWLAPSLQHQVDTSLAWVRRICRWAPVTALSCELVRFDMAAMENPDIEGVEYQQGALAGYELREYLLEKWGRKCAYCDRSGVALQVEHILARARGGSNRAANLTLACEPCNRAKGARDLKEFLAKDPARAAHVLAQARRPLKDATAVNATRWVLALGLKTTGLPVELASGGRTKFNRSRLAVPKTHALDAACVGELQRIEAWQRPTLQIKASGRGRYQRTLLTKHGFPRALRMRAKRVKGFVTGDLVQANVPKGLKAGTHVGRVAVRVNGSFDIQTAGGVVQGIGHQHCRVLQRADGYGYTHQPLDSFC